MEYEFSDENITKVEVYSESVDIHCEDTHCYLDKEDLIALAGALGLLVVEAS